VVITAVRDPSGSAAKALTSVSTDNNSKVIVTKVDSTSPTDARGAVDTLKTKHGISHLDVVIANAGVSKAYDKVARDPAGRSSRPFRG
jgi:norsolorinic acid ketoreductase